MKTSKKFAEPFWNVILVTGRQEMWRFSGYIALEKARMEIRLVFWLISLDIKTVNRSFYWATS